MMLGHALKEWAAICKALALGRQIVILRKGGLDESTGEFVLEHKRFWLYPTYVHQKLAGLHPEAEPLYHLSLLAKPAEGFVQLSHFAEVTGAYELHDLVAVYRLQPFHCLSQDVVEERFRYRRPGLHALTIRVFRAPQMHTIPETAAYAGCKTWVELQDELSAEGSTPVLTDSQFETRCRELSAALQPRATV
jgi:hypothetical protein